MELLLEAVETKSEYDVSELKLKFEVKQIDGRTEEFEFLESVPVKANAIIRLEEKFISSELYTFISTQAPTDLGNAKCVKAVYGNHFRYNDAFGLLFYNGKYWISGLVAKSALRLAIESVFTLRRRIDTSEDVRKCTRTNSNLLNNCATEFCTLPNIISSPEQFDSYNHLFNVANGVIDLRTGQLLPHSPNFYFTNCSPIEYKLDADYTKWVDFLDTVILNHKEDGAVSAFLKQSVGYSISGEMKEECMFYLQGQPRAGKGTFIFTLANVLGSLFENRGFSTFSSKRNGNDQGFDLAGLKGKRFVSASESDDKTSLNEAVVKNITGRDPITCSFNGKDQFTYAPMFKIWLSSNFLPKGNVDDSAFWARIRLILFSTSFLGKEDKNLKESFREPAFLEGVLRWVVEGAKDYYASSNGLKTPQCFVDALDQHREQQDTVAQWISESWHKQENYTCYVPTTSLYPAYAAWCQENDYQPVMKKRLFASLDAKSIKKELVNVKKDGKWTTVNVIKNFMVDGVKDGFFTLEEK